MLLFMLLCPLMTAAVDEEDGGMDIAPEPTAGEEAFGMGASCGEAECREEALGLLEEDEGAGKGARL